MQLTDEERRVMEAALRSYKPDLTSARDAVTHRGRLMQIARDLADRVRLLCN